MADKLDTPPKTKELFQSPTPRVKINPTQRVEVLEQEKHIRELESRLAAVNRDNECLRAEVDEANHWVYERGPIKAELLDLRRNNIMSLAELNRLTSENAQKTV